MQRLRRYLITTMFAGAIFALLYALFSAGGVGTERDILRRFATGPLVNMDMSERGMAAPDAPFWREDGTALTLNDFPGELIVVNFWATWCAPCEREMPSLAALQTARGSERFRVIAISVDSREDRSYAAQRLSVLSGGVLDFYHAPPEAWDIIYEAGAPSGFPSTLIYNGQGEKLAEVAGEKDWASYHVIGLIDALLDEESRD